MGITARIKSNHSNPKELRQDSLPAISLSVPDEYIRAMEDRIVEKLFNRLKPHIQSIQYDDELMTIEEAATFLKKSKAQIYQWVNNSRHGLSYFPYRKAGRSLRFSKKKLIEWMEQNSKFHSGHVK